MSEGVSSRQDSSYNHPDSSASNIDQLNRISPFKPLAAFILIGKTGSGKSSFIKLVGGRDLSGNKPIVDGSLSSCTKIPTVYLAAIGGRGVVLLDTPGFDDSGVENLKILNDIAANLYMFALQDEIQTRGVIFLHDISETRFGGSQRKTLEILRALCGPEGMKSCIIGTTMWSSPGSSRYRREEVREGEFRQKHWQGILKTTRIPEDDAAVVTGIINDILAHPPVLLQIQQEMLEPPHTLETTTVGKTTISEGRAEVDRLRKEFEDSQRLPREGAERRGLECRRQRQEESARFEAERARKLEDAREREEELWRLQQEKMDEEGRKRLEEWENNIQKVFKRTEVEPESESIWKRIWEAVVRFFTW